MKAPEKDVSPLLHTAMAAQRQGAVRDARRLYEQALRAAPRHPDALHLLGLTWLDEGQAERGLQLVEETQPSVVIVDIMMPRMDGFTVLQRIREIKADLPVIIFTARSTRSDEKKAEELGANGFVAKPFNRQKLLTAIERAINPTGAAISETITEK